MAVIDDVGREHLDQTPIAVPLRFKRQSFVDQIQTLVRQELSRQAQAAELETFEESDDFDVDDDPWIKSQYEIDADQEFASMYPVLNEPESTPQPAPQAKGSDPEAGSGAA